MKPTVLILVTALTLGLTQPAQARELDGGDLLWGLIALAIVGTAVDKIEDRQSAVTPSTPPPTPKVLPAHCMRKHRTRDGRVRMLGHRCLKRHSSFSAELPRRCFKRIQTRENKWRRGYGPRCLRNAGFAIR